MKSTIHTKRKQIKVKKLIVSREITIALDCMQILPAIFAPSVSTYISIRNGGYCIAINTYVNNTLVLP